MDLSRFSRDELILALVALALAVDLLFLPWIDITVGGFGLLTVSVTSPATGSPDGWLGIVAVLGAVALIADLALERLTSARLPALGSGRADTRLILAVAIAACLALKFLLHAHVSWLGGGFWGAFVLTVALVALANRARSAGATTVTR